MYWEFKQLQIHFKSTFPSPHFPPFPLRVRTTSNPFQINISLTSFPPISPSIFSSAIYKTLLIIAKFSMSWFVSNFSFLSFSFYENSIPGPTWHPHLRKRELRECTMQRKQLLKDIGLQVKWAPTIHWNIQRFMDHTLTFLCNAEFRCLIFVVSCATAKQYDTRNGNPQ